MDRPYTVDMMSNSPPEVSPDTVYTKLFRFQQFPAGSDGNIAWNFPKFEVTLRVETDPQYNVFLRVNVDLLTDSVGRYTTNHSRGQQDLFTFSLYDNEFLLDSFTISGIELVVHHHDDHPMVFSYDLGGFPRDGRNALDLATRANRLRYQTSGMCND